MLNILHLNVAYQRELCDYPKLTNIIILAAWLLLATWPLLAPGYMAAALPGRCWLSSRC